MICYYIYICCQIKVGCMRCAFVISISKGLDVFIDFVKKDMLDNVRGNTCCPCKYCKNENIYHINDMLRSHLI
jgi:hypothetical protein